MLGGMVGGCMGWVVRGWLGGWVGRSVFACRWVVVPVGGGLSFLFFSAIATFFCTLLWPALAYM